MAWLEQRGKMYRVSFRYDGAMYRHSLGTSDRAEADACLARLEDSLNRLNRGWLKLPAGADLTLFLMSGGEVGGKPIVSVPTPLSLSALSEAYLKAQEVSIERNSLLTIKIHLGHLQRTLGESFPVAKLALDDLQRHIDRRRKERGRRGPVTGYTIRKEIGTLSAAWDWARQGGKLTGQFPGEGLKYPKGVEKPPFQTREQIDRQIQREGLEGDAADALRDCLFLTLPEVEDFLRYVKENTRHGFLYPMACLAAHTGMRRSELLRARVTDVDVEGSTVLVHEKKRLKGRTSTRRVHLSPFLAGVLAEWQKTHPGGASLFCQVGRVSRSKTRREGPRPITKDEAHDHLRRTLEGGRWSVVRGWHVLRHSFITICAARGVDQRIIDQWVGHTSDEMRLRYRHLVPDQSANAIRSVFGES
jgi:integrase